MKVNNKFLLTVIGLLLVANAVQFHIINLEGRKEFGPAEQYMAERYGEMWRQWMLNADESTKHEMKVDWFTHMLPYPEWYPNAAESLNKLTNEVVKN